MVVKAPDAFEDTGVVPNPARLVATVVEEVLAGKENPVAKVLVVVVFATLREVDRFRPVPTEKPVPATVVVVVVAEHVAGVDETAPNAIKY